MKLTPVPANLGETRDALHRLAFFAVSPTRYKTVGRMGLRNTPGGFGTPDFEGRVVRLDGDLLIDEKDGNTATSVITTIREAAEFFGIDYEAQWFADFHDPLQPNDPDEKLNVDIDAARFIGRWFDFGFGALNALRGHGAEGDGVSEVQLWPEHFDPATELGAYEKGQRASFGASPGDESHPEPYLYVASWSEIDRSNPYWNNTSFNGASLDYAELATAADPEEKALEFLLQGYRVLHGG